MKKGMLLFVTILLAVASVVQADEPGAAAMAAPADELHGAINVTYLSRYIWRGITVFGKQSAILPSVDLDLYGTGFGVNVLGQKANSSGYELSEHWNYTLYYGNRLWESEPYATNYRISYVYYNYPKRSSHTRDSIDLQELNGILSWPNLLGVKGLVPSYVLVKMWPSNSGSAVGANSPLGGTASGFAHIFMLDYGWAIPAIVPNTAEQVLNLHAEVVYNDGVSPVPAVNVDHDWSNAVFGISTDFPICKDLTFTPGVYHQITMDKSVNTEKSITWASAGLTYKF